MDSQSCGNSSRRGPEPWRGWGDETRAADKDTGMKSVVREGLGARKKLARGMVE